MSLPSFKDREIAQALLSKVAKLSEEVGPVKIMEVCGTHTMEIGKIGLRKLLPKNLTLLSGPGCPVCVTPSTVIDEAIALAFEPNTTLMTFGDMVRVPGSEKSLEQAKAEGASVEIVSSPLQLIQFAQEQPETTFVFAAVGFETTTPSVAKLLSEADKLNIENIKIITAHRILPPALEALCADDAIEVAGFLLPGHVSAILGRKVYESIEGLTVPATVTGFEPLDILAGIYDLLTLIRDGDNRVTNKYTRVVREEGNPVAVEMINEVFESTDAVWRGIGIIPQSGLKLKEKYARYEAGNLQLQLGEDIPVHCSCGDVLRGIITPNQCKLFGKACYPRKPIGPCMVSNEGSCAAYYRYERNA